MLSDSKIVIIGSGNVATHLSKGLQAAGCTIVQVYSRHLEHATRLATRLTDCRPIDNLADMDRTADLYLIAVSDSAISGIAEQMHHVSGIVAHTSGSVPLETLKCASDKIAVLYPLQTFSREAVVELSEVPFFTEAINAEVLETIDKYGHMISTHVYHADSAQRKTLHIAGVLSCNFVNYLWDCTSEVLARDGYRFEVVEPLIKATLQKAVALGPRKSQTGPAMRCDSDVMKDHIERLDDDMAAIYQQLSRAIIKTHNLNCDL